MLFTCSMWLSGACLMRHIPRGANVRTEDMLAAPWGAESADFAGVEAKQWLVVCFCKLASTVWALFFQTADGFQHPHF